MYYLGIDGGGTKTAFALIDKKGKLLSKIEKGTCHYMQIGLEGFKHVIEEGISEICNITSISSSNIAYIFLGIPGYGEVSKNDRIIESILKDTLKKKKFFVGNDVVAGWAGSLACRPGINIVAGTGAIAYGVNEKGESARTSGWGHFCGDEGSAYWIAKKGIEVFSKEADNRLEKGYIYNVFKEELKLKKDFDLISLIHKEYKCSRTQVAKLAMLVYKAAENGDKRALDIFNKAADELYLMVKGIINQLNYSEKVLVSYSGGVFKSGEFVLKPFRKRLEELNCEIVKPSLSPVIGSALYAYKLDKNMVTDEIIKNLKDV